MGFHTKLEFNLNEQIMIFVILTIVCRLIRQRISFADQSRFRIWMKIEQQYFNCKTSERSLYGQWTEMKKRQYIPLSLE